MMAQRKTGAAALACAAVIAAGGLAGYEWPLADPAVSRTFGTPVDRSYSLSVGVVSEEETVRSAEAGDVVFYSEGGDGPLEGRGAWIAVRHEENLVSVYSGLRPGSVPAYLKRVGRGAVVGLAERSGDEDYESGFLLYDREKSQWVNPLLFLSPIEDSKAPAIRSVALKRDALPVDLSRTKSLRQGKSELIASFGDPGAGTGAVNAPFQVQAVLNGVEALNLIWDVAREREGRMLLFSGEGKSCGEFALEDGAFRIGSLPIVRGRATLDLIVTDYARNSRTASFSFQAD